MEKPDNFDTLKQSLQGLLEGTMNVAMAANILETYTEKAVKKVGMFRDYNTFKPEEEELWVKHGDIRVYDVAAELLFSGAALPTSEGWILSLNKHSILWVECFDDTFLLFEPIVNDDVFILKAIDPTDDMELIGGFVNYSDLEGLDVSNAWYNEGLLHQPIDEDIKLI